MTDAEKAEFWERMDTTDYKLEAFAARMDALAEEREDG